MNLFTILEAHAARVPDRVAIIGAEERFTFAELERRATRLAGALAARGIERGDRVAVLVPVSPDLYLVLLALLRLGATAVFVEPALGAAAIVRCLERTAPRGFIGVRRAHLLRLWSPRLRSVPLTVVAGRGFVPGASALEVLVRTGPPALTAPAGDPAAALLTFTSGTTAAPKAIERSHALLYAQHEVLSLALPMVPTDRGLSAAPLFALHDLAAGATAVLPPGGLRSGIPRAAERVRAAMGAHGVTLVRANPRFCEALAGACERSRLRLPDVRALFVGGAPVGGSLLERVRAVLPNAEVYVAYGCSEAEPIAAIAAGEVIAETAALTALGRGYCVGRPIPPTQLRIANATTATSFPGPAPTSAPLVGEIVVAGPHVNASAWHRTGDVGYLDGGGRLWLLGRDGDGVHREGRTIHPYSVEPLVESLPFVERCALVVMAHPVIGERIVLVVTAHRRLRPGRSARRRWGTEIARLCASRDVPVDEVRWIRTMPLEARHRSKIRRDVLRGRLPSRAAAR